MDIIIKKNISTFGERLLSFKEIMFTHIGCSIFSYWNRKRIHDISDITRNDDLKKKEHGKKHFYTICQKNRLRFFTGFLLPQVNGKISVLQKKQDIGIMKSTNIGSRNFCTLNGSKNNNLKSQKSLKTNITMEKRILDFKKNYNIIKNRWRKSTLQKRFKL